MSDVMGRIMALVLDAADPRHDETVRHNALESAAEIYVEGALAAAVSMLHAVLDGIRRANGDEAVRVIVAQLASVAMNAVDGLDVHPDGRRASEPGMGE